jgi:hypothetical protein
MISGASLRAHRADLRERRKGRGGPVGFGIRPALIAMDLALAWTDPQEPGIGSAIDAVERPSPGHWRSCDRKSGTFAQTVKVIAEALSDVPLQNLAWDHELDRTATNAESLSTPQN